MRWGTALAAVLLATLLVRAAVAEPAAAPQTVNLLAGRSPMSLSGVRRAAVLTDGVIGTPGDGWKTDRTAWFSSTQSFVQYDLGRSRPLRACYLQADSNDRYEVSVSEDGHTFTRLWRAPPVRAGGLRARHNKRLRGSGRYVRIHPTGGDGSYSVSELQLFADPPTPFPPRLVAKPGKLLDESVHEALILFGVLLTLFVVVCARRAPRWLRVISLLLPAVGCTVLLSTIAGAWPVNPDTLSMLRVVMAAAAGVIVIREAHPEERFAAQRWGVVAALSICAVLAVAAFYNLGRPQFQDHDRGVPTAVHTYDMRVYFPQAKYFDELGFDGVYLASIAAYLDDAPGASMKRIGKRLVRDLKTHGKKPIAETEAELAEVRARFSPARWEAFKQDMRFFRKTMGDNAYLGSMHDHGGNATPVWLMIAHLLLSQSQASHEVLMASALLDPLLLLLLFVAIGRCFGVRTMLITMVVFGANDFYMYGTNWAGATLRLDWMVYFGLGLCALKKERWVLGGVLLALSCMIRVVPTLAFGFVLVPALWWVWRHRQRHGRLPTLGMLWEEQGPTIRVLLGGVGCVVALFLLSSALFSFSAWVDWVHKMVLLSKGEHLNHVSLRTLIGGWAGEGHHLTPVRARVFMAGLVAYVLAALFLCRRRRLEHAALLGLLLVPVVLYPANYYIHFIFLLPLLATERRGRTGDGASAAQPWARADVGILVSVLGICVAQYWTVLTHNDRAHFIQASLVLFIGITAVLFAVAAKDRAVETMPAARADG